MNGLHDLSLKIGGSVKQGQRGSHLRIGDVRVYPRQDYKWDVWHKGKRVVLNTCELKVWLS